MAKVVADMSMSLDGYVAGPNDSIDEVFSWMMAGEVTVETDNPELEIKTDEVSAKELENWSNIKALVIGRRTFDLAGGWGGTHPVGVPVWIPTHDPPDGWDDAPFTFVTEGEIERWSIAGVFSVPSGQGRSGPSPARPAGRGGRRRWLLPMRLGS
jgi:dihydrofolate reductase